MPNMEAVQAIVTKRTADVKYLFGKQILQLFQKEIMRKSKRKIKSLCHEPDDLRTYIGTLKQVHSSTICDQSLNAIQGYEDSDDSIKDFKYYNRLRYGIYKKITLGA